MKVNLPDDVVYRAYETAENMLRDAVENAQDKEHFFYNLAFCQILASRMIGVLIFNGFVQAIERGEDVKLKSYIDQAFDCIRGELSLIEEEYENGEMETLTGKGAK